MITNAIDDATVIVTVGAACVAIACLSVWLAVEFHKAWREMRGDPAIRRIIRDGYDEARGPVVRESVILPYMRSPHKYPCDCGKGGHNIDDEWIDCKLSRMPKKEAVKS